MKIEWRIAVVCTINKICAGEMSQGARMKNPRNSKIRWANLRGGGGGGTNIVLQVLSLKSFGNSYILCLLLIIMIRFTCGDTKVLPNIKMSQNIITRIV